MRATANVAQVKARLSEYLRQVKSGGEVLITERGVPVARLAPLDESERRATREDRLVRAGVLRPAQGPRKKLGKPRLRRAAGVAVLDYLLSDRQESE